MAAMGGGAGGGGRGPRDMRLTMQEAAKKLSLWDSATFRPILTHVELEPILAAAGFVALPTPPPPTTTQGGGAAGAGSRWRGGVRVRRVAAAGRRRRSGNAAVAAGGGWLGPRPRLPCPRVDALHLRTYQAFLGAVEFYLGALRVASLFHVRSIPSSSPRHGRILLLFFLFLSCFFLPTF